MAFNTARLVTTKYGGKGILGDRKEITLDAELPKGYWVEDPTKEKPLYKFVWRDAFGFHLEPVDQPEGMIGPMGDGLYAEIDCLVRRQLAKAKCIPGYAVPELMPVHARFETPEQYDRLTR